MSDEMTSSPPEAPPRVSEDDPLEHQGLGEESVAEVLPAREPFRSMLRWLSLAEQSAGVALMVVILVLVLVQVAQRYLPGGGVAWTGEISRFSMVWLTFVLSGYLLAHDGHIAIKVVDYVLPARSLAALKLLGHAFIAVTAVAFVYATYDFMTHDRGQVTAAAEVPLAAIYAVIAYGFASTALRAVVAILVVDIPQLRARGEAVT